MKLTPLSSYLNCSSEHIRHRDLIWAIRAGPLGCKPFDPKS